MEGSRRDASMEEWQKSLVAQGEMLNGGRRHYYGKRERIVHRCYATPPACISSRREFVHFREIIILLTSGQN